MSWVKQLLEEYAEGRRALVAYRMTLLPTDPDEPVTEEIANEVIVVNGMISDMQFAIDWMEKGRRPGSKRGIDRRAVYQRTVLMDTDLFPSLAEPDPEPTTKKKLTLEQRQKVLSVIRELSEQELNCYLLHAAKGMSFAAIGEEMKIAKGTVQNYVKRAKSKVAQAI